MTTLPCDLLVDIFCRLETTALIRCAATCRPWRRAIVDNASCFRPRPDRLLPDLLIGSLDICSHMLRRDDIPVLLQYAPASSNTTVPAAAFFTPAGGGFNVSVDGMLYNIPISSRDGFLLLRGKDKYQDLCLCNPMTGVCRVLPAAAFDDHRACTYALATAYDVDGDYTSSDNGSNEKAAVWIIAVVSLQNAKNDGVTYQIFSSTSGAWGPIKRSPPEQFPAGQILVYIMPNDAVIWRGAVYWVLKQLSPNAPNRPLLPRTSMFAMDLRTERTWMTTDLPAVLGTVRDDSLVLATSEDGRLSVVNMRSSSFQMDVWVLIDDGQWTLRRTIDVRNLLPLCQSMDHIWKCGFFPRSGCLNGTGKDDQGVVHHFLIGIDGSSPRLTGRVNPNSQSLLPYEMDVSTYISEMKYL